MCNVAHFFGKDVADIVLAFDVKNFKGLVLNPFAHRVLSEFDVTHGFQCHVVGPENTGTVVVEHFGGPGDVTGQRYTAGFETPREIPGSDGELAAHVRGVYLCFT